MKQVFLSKWIIAGAAVLALAAGAVSSRMVARAQEMQPQTFIVQAGAFGVQNSEVLAFAPQTLQVHRGDTVTWEVNSFHNIHFESAPTPLVVAPEVDGKPLPQINPAVAFRTIDTGAAYSGGDANSGLPLAPEDAVFSLVIDLAPGTYTYMCDVHPGMVGILTVVADGTAVPGLVEVSQQSTNEFAAALANAAQAGLQLEMQTMDAGMVQAGSGDTGRATVNQFFPTVTMIKAGESITFTNPQTSIEPHTISWPPARGQDVEPMPVEGGPPVLLMGPTIRPDTQSGTTVGIGDAFSSGLILPGQTFSLTFSEPGIYSFTCNIHPGMNGTIVVEPSA